MYRVHELPIDSALLRGNPTGDPHERTLLVLAPEGHDPAVATPVVWMLPGYSGSQGGFLADDPWKEGLPRRAARLVRGGMKPMLFALPDLFTKYGGSQALDSAATGPYERHLWEELRPALESRFSVSSHGLTGHSSGGYAAIVQAMRHPEIVRAVACHAGDMHFDLCYRGDFARAADRIRAAGGVAALLEAFEKAPRKLDGRWLTPMNLVAMATCYSANPASPDGFDLPFTLDTCELRADVWERWLEWDPVRMIEKPQNVAALKQLSLLFIDAGTRDEFGLHWGARALTKRLNEAQVPHTYEEFDDGHRGTSYRFDRSLPLLAEALHGTRS